MTKKEKKRTYFLSRNGHTEHLFCVFNPRKLVMTDVLKSWPYSVEFAFGKV